MLDSIDRVRGSYNRHSCQPSQLWDAPLLNKVSEKSQDIARTLIKYAKQVSVLIIATDNDREGENIGFEVIDECTRVNKRLRLKRMLFSGTNPAQIRQVQLYPVPFTSGDFGVHTAAARNNGGHRWKKRMLTRGPLLPLFCPPLSVVARTVLCKGTGRPYGPRQTQIERRGRSVDA